VIALSVSSSYIPISLLSFKVKRILLYIFIISVSSIRLPASGIQLQDTTIELKTVDINAERLHQVTTGLKIETIDSLTLSHYISSNLADILSSQSTLYMKSYGLGSLSDISIRGTAPEQNAIFWNGFNLNVPNIGLSDFALVPGSFFNKIEILYGGASSIYGNGIIGGSIHLENEPVFGNHHSFDISSSIGSFYTFNENLRAVIANTHLYSSTAVTINSAENNFPFTNTTKPKNPEERQTNANAYNYGIMQQISDKISENQTMDAAIWYQYDNRSIPASLTENSSEAKQIDESLRSSLQWKKNTDNMSLIAKGAYFYNFEHYTNPFPYINSKIVNNSGNIDLEFNKHFYCRACAEANDTGKTKHALSLQNIQNNSFDFNAGINYTLNEADITSYNGNKQRNDAAVFASVSHNFTAVNWKADFNLRQEFTQGYNVPLTPSFGIEGRIWKYISGRLNISENFRMPTLNELYWQPGQNLNLKPETSSNQEAGIIFKHQSSVITYQYSITVFNSNINNWIQWVPDSNNIFTPKNIKEVRSRGVEINGNWKLEAGNWKVSVNVGYSYTKSTNQKKASYLDNSVGKQLIYVPVNSALASVSINYKTLEFYYSQNFIDSRYTTSDNSSDIPGYSLGSLYISKQFHFHHNSIGFQFNIDNVWNVSYEAIEYRPMPGRIYRFTFNFKLS
jgi:vitamin B12 transporter